MNFARYAAALVLMAALATGGLFAQQTTAKAYDKLKKEIEGVAKDTAKFSSSLKATSQSLTKVSISEAKDLQKSIKSFGKEVENLNKSLKNATASITGLSQKRAAYFAEWEKSVAAISSPELKQASEERRQKVMADHAQLTEKANALREKIDTYMKEIADVANFLGGDPTQPAVAAAKATIDKAVADGNSLAASVQEVSNQLAAFAKGAS